MGNMDKFLEHIANADDSMAQGLEDFARALREGANPIAIAAQLDRAAFIVRSSAAMFRAGVADTDTTDETDV